MGKRRRPDLPGRAFHLTTRLQGREHLFNPVLRDRVVRILARQVAVSDLRLLAYVVMTNHLHLVVIQGVQPLGRFMQPFLRSVALAVQQAHRREGHVFERPYRDRLCRDEAHLRNAIVYTHANPVAAGLCSGPADYRWSSHGQYTGSGRGLHDRFTPRVPVDIPYGLRAFAPGDREDTAADSPACRAARARYQANLGEFIAACSAPQPHFQADPAVAEGNPPAANGTGPARGVSVRSSGSESRLEVIAEEVLRARGSPFPLHAIRSRWGPRERLSLRAEVARACTRAGHSGLEIARFLDLSPATVSRMLNTGPNTER